MKDCAVGYVVNSYPRPSHSFIRREIRALEATGLTVARFAMRRDPGDLVDAGDRTEAAQTEYVLDAGILGLAGALLGALIRRPRPFLSALGAALAAGRRGGPRRGMVRQMVYLAEAARQARRAHELGLVHLHAHFGTNSADVARYAARLGGIGFSMTVHGPEEFDAPEALSLPQKLAEARFAVGVSAFGRSQLCRWTDPSRWDRLHVVHCGVEAALFADPAPLPPGPSAEHPLRMVAIGRFAEQKGHPLLIEALARVSAPVDLTLVGDGPMAGDLRRQITESGLADRVSLPGWLDEAGVRAALADAHLLVLPSFAEGLPVVLMEAMAAGRPAIATWIAGIPELMIDGETGWLVPAGDAGTLAAAIEDAAATSSTRLAGMGRVARSRALARHDASAEAVKLAELFRAKNQP